MQDPEEKQYLDRRYPHEPIGKRYVYEGKPGKILVDGVERDVTDLNDSERVAAGEQMLRDLSDSSGTPVKDLRKELAELAVKASGKAKPPARLQLVKTAHGTERPMLVNHGQNRKQRRTAEANARRR